jgi:RND superfamily putative drug exporter
MQWGVGMIFDRLGKFIVKRYKAVLVLWVIILAVSIPLAVKSSNVVSYQQTSSGTTGTTDSEKAQAILDEQFPRTISNSTFLIVIQADNVSSPAMRDFMLGFEQRARSDPKITYMEQGEPGAFPKGFVSVYTAQRYILIQAVSGMNAGLYLTEGGVNQTAYMLYGVPAMHAQNWATSTNASANVTTRDFEAYGITAAAVAMMVKGMDPQTAAMTSGYFQAFMGAWNATAQVPALAADPFARADQSVRNAAPVFISGMPLPPAQAQLMGAVATAFSVKTFSSHAAIHAFSVGMVAAGAHITDMAFLEGVYGLGPLSALSPADQLGKVSTFVDQKVLPNGTLDTYPIGVPAELRSGFVSQDNTVTIVSVGFSKGDEYTEPDGKKPIVENVAEFRALLKDMRSNSNATGLHTYVSGGAAISSDIMSSAFGDMSIIEFVTIPLLIILMGIFFRSVLTPVLPLSAVMIALGLSQAMMFIIGTFIAPVDSQISTMLFTILMGVGTDYSIFIVARYREERIKGATRGDAVQTSVTWAGESIVTSGATVMIAFFSLGIANYQMIKIMGLVLGLSILMALLIALTLVPALLMLTGNRIFWPNSKERFKRYAARIMARRRKKQHGYFYKAARFSVRNAKAVVLAAILVSIPTAYISLTTETSYDFIGAMPAVESTDGMTVMTSGFGAGRIMPSTVVLVFGSDVLQPDGNLSATNLAIVEAVSARLAARSIVHEVTGPSRPYGVIIDYAHPGNISLNNKQKARDFIGQDNRTVRLSFVLNAEPMSNEAVNAVPGLRSSVRDAVSGTGVKAYVGGSTAGMYDVKLQMDDQFRQMEIVVVIGIFIVLLLVLGSVALPAFAIISIGMSITWSFAATYLIFGWWLNVPILFMVPLILFIMLMGLGMDYNIFILTRIREEVAKGKDNETAIVDAVDWTGGIITALAIIMGGAIGALMLSSTKMLAEFGFALSFAILLDAMVVRTYIVPATMKLLGKWNWWAPGPLGRLRKMNKGKKVKASKGSSEE